MQSIVQNFEIDSCSFTEIVLGNNGVFLISNLGQYSTFDMYGGYASIVSNGSSITAYTSPKNSIFSNLNFSNITYSGSFLSVNQYPNVYFQNVKVYNTDDMSYDDYNIFVINNFINSPTSYIRNKLQSELVTTSVCLFFFNIASGYTL